MLNKMRVGELEHKAVQQFQRLSRKVRYEDDIEPTQLYVLQLTELHSCLRDMIAFRSGFRSKMQTTTDCLLYAVPHTCKREPLCRFVFMAMLTRGWTRYKADDIPGYDKVMKRTFSDGDVTRALERVIALKEVSLKVQCEPVYGRHAFDLSLERGSGNAHPGRSPLSHVT